MRHVVIDDERSFLLPGELHYLRTSDEGLAFVARAFTEFMLKPWGADSITFWLDHDLGVGDTIQPVVDFLCVIGEELPHVEMDWQINVHSQNPVGAANVVRQLVRAGWPVRRVGLPS